MELTAKECFLLRTSLSYIRFTEEEKKKMTEKQKKDFIDPPKREYTSEEMKLMQMSITEKIAYLFDGEKEK